MGHDLAQLAKLCGGRVNGDGTIIISSVAPIDTAGPDQVAYLELSEYQHCLETTKAGAVLLTEENAKEYSGNAIIVSNPRLGFAILAQKLHPSQRVQPGIHPSAQVSSGASISSSAWIGPNVVVGRDAEIADHVSIGAGCYLGESVSIGSGTILHANVSINAHCIIGEECIFQPGVVIGGDGFGYVADARSQWIRIPQIGKVIISDRVELGANTTVDRGALKDTEIHSGVKIDNLVQIGHNVIVGENTIIAAGAGIAGSAIIGKRCSIGGQAGVMGHLEIGDDVAIAGKSMVSKSISGPGIYSSSLRVDVLKKWQKNQARIYQLDEMARRLGRLEKEIKKLS